MKIPAGFLLQLAIILQRRILTSGEDERYFFAGPQAHFQPSFRPSENRFVHSHGFGKIPPGFEHLDTYLAHPDLDTSDLSPHLRRTLPQYQVGFLENPINPLKFQVRNNPEILLARPAPFSHQIPPSTHRPNYSHLFSKTSHNHNPQTETFLGQITIQSPADLPKTFQGRGFQPSTSFSFNNLNQLTPPVPEKYSRFQNDKVTPDKLFKFPQIVNQHLDVTEKPVLNNTPHSRDEFLNHRTRIFAPESGSLTKIDGYFVNRNGDVFDTLKSTTSLPITTLNRKRHFNFTPQPTTSTQPTRTIENTFNLDSLLEEPLNKRQPSSNDNVEVIQPVTLPPDKFYTIKPFEDTETEPPDPTDNYDVTSDLEYETIDPTEDTEINTVVSEESVGRNDSGHPLYDVLTIKPSVMVKDDQFSKFVDSSEIDVTTENQTSFNQSHDDAIVSIVTTKSVINNTMVEILTTHKPPVTQQMELRSTGVQVSSPISHTGDEETSTEGWVVVASVQTSRSVSGARYLPFPVVEQHERTKLLNEPELPVTSTESQKFTTNPPPSDKSNSSTESLIDKLDRVQSDLSSDVLTDSFNSGANHIALITEANVDKSEETTVATHKTQVASTLPPVVIRKFSPHARPSTTRPKFAFKQKSIPAKTTTKQIDLEKPQGDQPDSKPTTELAPKSIESLLSKIKFKDVGDLLPADYKETQATTTKPNSSDILSSILKKSTTVDLSSILPSDYKTPPTKEKSHLSNIFKKSKSDDISAFLPPGYKPDDAANSPSDNSSSDLLSSILKKAKQNDVLAFLPPDYKPSRATSKPRVPSTSSKSIESLLSKSKPVDISAFLPPGYKPPKIPGSTTQPKSMLENAKEDDISALLPPGYKSSTTSTTTSTSTTTTEPVTTKNPGNFKVVFPSRPGGATTRKVNRLTTPKATDEDADAPVNNLQPTIHKGWPSRATTVFTGWPTPSTTPISIEKLLEAARAAASTTTTTTTSTTTITTTVSTTPTTTAIPTTPGLCWSECDLAGTIKLTNGVKWAPELLDRNTREWQLLANEVQYQLEDVFTKSDMLNKWYKKIRIDGFSEGSVLVDYVVELNNVSQQVNTREIKGLFNSALTDAFMRSSSSREAKASDLTRDVNMDGKLILGNFIVDPTYTDFVVLPKQILPTVGYAEEVFLPQWAIAIIVIGLASLLFVIIFGVTVLINKQKNAKKKQPLPLTEDMLNELNKNHLGGFDNYAAEDLYNMDDVWNETPYETKLPKKRSAGSIHEASMPNMYDSWKSEWNGYYYNNYYGNNAQHPTGSQLGNGRRRSDYDTNF